MVEPFDTLYFGTVRLSLLGGTMTGRRTIFLPFAGTNSRAIGRHPLLSLTGAATVGSPITGTTKLFDKAVYCLGLLFVAEFPPKPGCIR